MIKISQLTNQGTINFNNNKITITTLTSTNNEIEKNISLNFNNDLKLIENDIVRVKQLTENYKNSLNGWIQEESTELQNLWAEKRNPGLNQYLKQLSEWTNKTVSNIIYDSNINDNFNEVIISKGKNLNNLMFVIETDGGNIFGSYHTIIPPKPSQWVIRDKNHFVFSLLNPYGTKPIKFTPIIDECYPLWVYKSTPGLFCIQSFCHISTNKHCYINSRGWSGKSFNEMYNDTVGKDGKLFTKIVFPSHFGLKRLVVLTWK
ncbi:hypothetical protein EDI_028110 [Entamoeba dispar SAW760]|uniref:TLDc domain-containing protein n=1 Tax=Entamoeba dispar (strain ATCC PRA-260 / SAW760) TaxID=370354 RepID=B0EC91_ENTDS|nr:uncharacterized protein EDI_028110 [Entamoeba dispar SAW760]EDR27855.1 hypothetical protein EDI_028110 [Entamoeba dispar SAW760]|eukprot:EDR27855.1 hypothetical protein EDI_028110 [Entamoeba dispar SAW760]